MKNLNQNLELSSNPILTQEGKTVFPNITIVALYTHSNAPVRVALLVRPLGIKSYNKNPLKQWVLQSPTQWKDLQ